MSELLARVALIAEQARAKEKDKRTQMRERFPEWAAQIDEWRRVLTLPKYGEPAKPHAVTVDGVRYGPAPLEAHQNYEFAKPEPTRKRR